MPLCESQQTARSSLHWIYADIGWEKAKADNLIHSRGIQQEGHLRTEQSWQLSRTEPEVIRVREQAGVNSSWYAGVRCYKPCWLSMRAKIERRQDFFTGRDCVSTGRLSWMNSLKEAQSLPAAISPPAARLRSMAGIHPKQHLAQDLGSRGAFKTSLCAHISPGWEKCFEICAWSGAGQV